MHGGSVMKRSMICACFVTLSPLMWTATAQTPVAPAVADTTPPRDSAANHPVVHECDSAKPAWIFCDDFETNRLSRYFEYSHPDSSFERADSVGVLGSFGMHVRFRKGQVDAGSLKLALGKTPSSYIHPVDSGATVYRELYWRVYLRNDSTWTGGGGDKLSRVLSLVTPSWAEAMGAPVWSGGKGVPESNYLVIDPFSGTDATGTIVTTTYNDFPHLRWLGALRGATPIFDQSHVGKWYCIEAHVRLNDPGQSNGVFQLWIDDWLEAGRSDLNWVGRYTDYGLNAVFFENYWNAGSPVEQSRYMDNIVVSTERIGCGRLVGRD
jgi:hypothetical protein